MSRADVWKMLTGCASAPCVAVADLQCFGSVLHLQCFGSVLQWQCVTVNECRVLDV